MRYKKFFLGIFFLSFLAITTSISSCKAGEGCPNDPQYKKSNTDKDGQLSTKRGKSSLFSKKQKKKMKN